MAGLFGVDGPVKAAGLDDFPVKDREFIMHDPMRRPAGQHLDRDTVALQESVFIMLVGGLAQVTNDANGYTPFLSVGQGVGDFAAGEAIHRNVDRALAGIDPADQLVLDSAIR